MTSARRALQKLLDEGDITIDGTRLWDVQIHNEKVFRRILAGGTLAAGESYMDGWWDAPVLDEFFAHALRMKLDRKMITPAFIYEAILARLFNRQSRARASQVAHAHYDLGNDLYEAMLGKRMIYTCAYWSSPNNPHTLDEAQEEKLDLVCRKLGLKKDDRVLDIGCGWGGFAQFATERYGARVVGITVSKEQLALAQERCAGLPIELRLQDYREVNEKFDHIVSIEMFEAVGYKNYREYFKVVERCLKDEGLFLLQTISSNKTVRTTDAWIDKYIFPNGALPSMKQIAQAVENLFVIEDVHNFGADYDRTLMEWFKNFKVAWPSLKEKYGGERFYRMWKYYLLSCAGAFRSRNISDWQIVFSKKGVLGGYISVR